jgi:choline dehydrogenase-like flavoprotein
MRFFLLVFFVSLVFGFTHEAPGEPCTNTRFPEDANEANTYDYIFVGSGHATTVTAAKLAEDSNCALKILIVEAGRSYTDETPDCTGDIDCYNRGTENYYHLFPQSAGFHAQQTRGEWAFVSRPQVHSNSISYSDGRDPAAYCPLNQPYLLPGGCYCTSDKQIAFGNLCQVSVECLTQNAGNQTLCGEVLCPSNKVCAQNNTNLYWRSRSKGGSGSHHFMVSYHMSPFVAQEWVNATGQSRFSHANWMRAIEAIDRDWGKWTYTSTPFTPVSSYQNDTLKALLQQAGIAHGLNDFSTGANRITNSDQFWTPETLEKYFGGMVADQFIARQMDHTTGRRSWPSTLLDRAMATCGPQLVAECNAFVHKILFDDTGATLSRRAIGVEYTVNENAYSLDFHYNQTYSAELRSTSSVRAFARKGVILGAGVFESPQLLKHAGIGPQSELDAFDIPMRKHLPAVGENLKDDNEITLHYWIVAGGDPAAANNIIDPAWGTRPYFVPDIIKRLWAHNSAAFDPMTGVPNPLLSVYLNTMCHAGAVSFGGRACPTIPNSAMPIYDDPGYLSSYNHDGKSPYLDALIGSSTQLTFYRNEEERSTRRNPTCLAICVAGGTLKGWYDLSYGYGGALGSPFACDVLTTGLKSTGSVRLRSADPTDHPIVDTNAFSVHEDVIHTGECVNEMRKLMDRFNTISASNTSLYAGMHAYELLDIPTFSVHPSVSKTEHTPELEDFLKKALWHHHPTTSNKMGNQNDANSVVDHTGRVWGTSNLYVMDTSVFPIPPDLFPSTNAQAFGYLQAEHLLSITPPDSRTCDPNSFRGARNADQLDTTPNPLVTPLVIGYVLAGVFLLLGAGLAIYLSQTRRASGYKRL